MSSQLRIPDLLSLQPSSDDKTVKNTVTHLPDRTRSNEMNIFNGLNNWLRQQNSCRSRESNTGLVHGKHEFYH
jgi:hypothetical protein